MVTISKQSREEEGCQVGGEEEGCQMGGSAGPELTLEFQPHNQLVMGPWTRYFNYITHPFPTCKTNTLSLTFTLFYFILIGEEIFSTVWGTVQMPTGLEP